MRISEKMERTLDNAGWTIFGTTVAVMATPQLLFQVGTATLSAVAAYVAVHFAKMFLNRYAPIKKKGDE